MTNQIISWGDNSFSSGTQTYGTYNVTFTTPAGTEIGAEEKEKTIRTRTSHQTEINPRLYFKYVKSKLGKVQKEKLKRRLAKLQGMIQQAQVLSQKALYEELCKQLAVCVRETEADVIGCGQFIDRETITKYIGKVKDKVVKFESLADFPRVIPKAKLTKISQVQATKVFDEYHILYVDYTKEVVKTNEKRIREKDPICFGTFAYQPDRFYFICDWVDEYCDITLSKLADAMKIDDPEFEIGKVKEMDKDEVDRIVQEVKDRHSRLANTKRSNYEKLAGEDAEATKFSMSRAKNYLKKFWSKK